jgi:ATP-dependent helicase HrpB
MLVAADGAWPVAQACAILSERHLLPPRTSATTSDLLAATARWTEMPPHVKHTAANVASSERRGSLSDADFRRAILAGYPDRVAQRREPKSPRLLLSTGAGATLSSQSGVVDGEFLVALDVRVSTRPNDPDAQVRLASIVDRDWLRPTSVEIVHRSDQARAAVKAVAVERYDALTLSEKPVDVDPSSAPHCWRRRGPDAGRRDHRRSRAQEARRNRRNLK